MTTEEFKSIVNDDVRASSSSTLIAGADTLRDLDNVRDWLDTLVIMKTEVEFQLSANNGKAEVEDAKREAGQITDNEWVTFLEAHTKWRNGSLRFKTGVEVRIIEAKAIIRDSEEFYYDEDGD